MIASTSSSTAASYHYNSSCIPLLQTIDMDIRRESKDYNTYTKFLNDDNCPKESSRKRDRDDSLVASSSEQDLQDMSVHQKKCRSGFYMNRESLVAKVGDDKTSAEALFSSFCNTMVSAPVEQNTTFLIVESDGDFSDGNDSDDSDASSKSSKTITIEYGIDEYVLDSLEEILFSNDDFLTTIMQMTAETLSSSSSSLLTSASTDSFL